MWSILIGLGVLLLFFPLTYKVTERIRGVVSGRKRVGEDKMKIYVDGNPEEVCCITEDGKIDRAPIDGVNTNNVAEYRAILFGLFKHPEATEVVSDSHLAVMQLLSKNKTNEEHLRALRGRVLERVKKLGHPVEFIWVRGDKNPAGKILG